MGIHITMRTDIALDLTGVIFFCVFTYWPHIINTLFI